LVVPAPLTERTAGLDPAHLSRRQRIALGMRLDLMRNTAAAEYEGCQSLTRMRQLTLNPVPRPDVLWL
jgi:hypothetical protein